MDWKDVGKTLGTAAPAIGALIAGPAGGAIGALVASALGAEPTPAGVSSAVANDPNAFIKLRQLEADHALELQRLVVTSEQNRLAADTTAITAVNTTMQAEAKSDHWPTYSWRPFCGFVFGTMFLGCYFVLPLFKLPVPVVPTEAWLAMGGVLGVASYFRGKAQADPGVPTDGRG